MDPELGLFSGSHPLGPGIAQQAVCEQPEVVGLRVGSDVDRHALCAETGFLKRHPVRPGRDLDVDRTRRPRAGLERAASRFELQEDVGQGDVTLIADVGYQHLTRLQEHVGMV